MAGLWRAMARTVALALVLPMVLGWATEARATATFSAATSVSLTITGIANLTTPGDFTDLEIFGGVFSEGFFGGPLAEVFAFGNATGTASATVAPELLPPDFDPVLLGLGDVLSMVLSAAGTADATGDVDSFAEAFGVITVDNHSSTDSFEVSFALAVDLSTDAGFDDPLTEDAFAFAEIFAFAEFAAFYYDAVAETDALFGPFGPDSFVDLVTFTVLVAPDSFDDVLMFASADGFAEAIAEPGTLAIFGLGLAGLGFMRRRRAA